MKKIALLSVFAGAMMLAATNASAVMEVLTMSGTGQFQSTDKQNFPVIEKRAFSQKDLLYILALATDDQSITNQPTKIFYDPNAFNLEGSTWGATNGVGGIPFDGIFYYSNSIAGLKRLDGVDSSGKYYSCMEFDFYNSVANDLAAFEGFWNYDAMEFNSATTESHDGNTWTVAGTALLYIHSNPYSFDILGKPFSGGPPIFYYANNVYYSFQSYAVVLHGSFTHKITYNQKHTTVAESFTLKGSGDINYDLNGGAFNGTAIFTGKGPNDFK